MATQYDYAKAATLDNKARQLTAQHRRHVFDPAIGDKHYRALKRLCRLMGPYWQSQRTHKAGEWMLHAYA